ncbi:MAG: hypothetical protein P1U42_04565 [Phycisphaerales bacterium]|nr:hypothetical protein [Phycisphaerales bacterium]
MKTKQFIQTRAQCVACSILLGIGCSTLPLGGCQLFNERSTAEPHAPYPEDIAQGEVFDIQVFRDVTLLKFTNTTTHEFGPSVIWINKRYSLPIDGVASGETVELNLLEFVDEFGDVYRAGGFFAQRTPAPVVLVQIETIANEEPTLFGMVVVENKYN